MMIPDDTVINTNGELAAQYQQLILALWLFSTLLRLGSWLLCLWKLDVFIHSRYF